MSGTRRQRDAQTWIFQGNPDKFDIDGYVASDEDRISWRANQSREEIRPGDRVFLWRSAGQKTKAVSGIIAECTVVSIPWQGHNDPAAEDGWNEAPASRSDQWHVWLRVECIAHAKQVVKRAWLEHDPVCRDMRILKFAAATNFLVEPRHVERLERLWERTGVDWTRADSVAGLWAYDATYQGEVSKSAGRPVSDVALRIGRAVGGVYNKVMNFRALDPRDDRAGLPAGAAVDGDVWREFYDEARKELRSADLEAAYHELWSDTISWPEPGAPPRAKCVVWNNLSPAHIESAIDRCVSSSLGRVAFQRGGGVLRSIAELADECPGALEVFIVQRKTDQVVARGRIERLFRRADMSTEELADATKYKLSTDDALDADFILIATDVVRCEPPLNITAFDKCSDGTPLKPRGQWPASICYLPRDVLPRVPVADIDDELAGFLEGQPRTRMVNHRRRERSLRDAKIREAIRLTGAVRCEVDACGFDFLATYGEVGREYGQVHHLKPLASNDGTVVTRLEDLAILCANCHAIVHRGGECRSLAEVAALQATAPAARRTPAG